MTDRISRRRFVYGAGAMAAATALAGCSGGGGDQTTEQPEDEPSPTPEPTDGDGESGGSGGVPSAVSEYLSGVGNFDGSLSDQTGESEVTVTVGAEGNGGAFAFAPPAVRVSTGTTVVWEWTGEGGSHNVVAEEGADFESELVAEEGHTFSHTFESSGTVTYFCEPHKSLGMKGAVVVE